VAPEEVSPTVREGDLIVDLASREVTDGGVPLELTGLEFDLLSALVRRAGRVVTREALLRETKREEVSDRAVDVHISHLRQKLQDDPPRRIKTVRGVGYVFAKETK
jgi:DNA-binding response OmpR family regulator